MIEPPAPGFADLLRQLRVEARLTQEELAEAAGLSPRTVSDLERRVNRTAHKDTAGLLADSLGLAGLVRVLFVAAGPRPLAAAEVLAASVAGASTLAASTSAAGPRPLAAATNSTRTRPARPSESASSPAVSL